MSQEFEVLNFGVRNGAEELPVLPDDAVAEAETNYSSFTIFRDRCDSQEALVGSVPQTPLQQQQRSGTSPQPVPRTTMEAEASAAANLGGLPRPEHHEDPHQGDSPLPAQDGDDTTNPAVTQQSAKNEASSVAQQQRHRSATNVMTYQRNRDPNASPPKGGSSTEPNSNASSPGGIHSSKKMYSVGAVQIKSTSIADVISKTLSDTATQELLQELLVHAKAKAVAEMESANRAAVAAQSAAARPPTASSEDAAPPSSSPQPPTRTPARRKAPPTTLPSELKLPMPLRCDFCQKFDSVCSNCHFKWRGIAVSRTAVFTASFGTFPEHRRLPIFFNTAAYGTVPFLSAILDTLGSRISELQASFVPLVGPSDDAMQRLEDAGDITLLHVACGMGRRDIAKLLLERGALIVKSPDKKVSPIDLLPRPLPQDWLDALEAHTAYEEFTMIERARRLRSESSFEAALLEYQAVIKNNPYSEQARCGIAKTMYDQGDLEECIRACDSVLHDQKDIRWLEHIPESVVLLRSEAVKAFHERCHNEHTTALRRCGCVVVDPIHHRVRLRKIPFRVLVDRILPFCDCSMLWTLCQATRIPLIQSATERIASKIGLESVGAMLTNEWGYTEMYEALRGDEPPMTGPNAVVRPPLRFLGVQVIAMADFHTFLMRASVVGANPKYNPDASSFFSFGKKSETAKRPRVVATKCFRVYRAGVGKAWEIGDGGEWEVDIPASEALMNAVQQRLSSK